MDISPPNASRAALATHTSPSRTASLQSMSTGGAEPSGSRIAAAGEAVGAYLAPVRAAAERVRIALGHGREAIADELERRVQVRHDTDAFDELFHFGYLSEFSPTRSISALGDLSRLDQRNSLVLSGPIQMTAEGAVAVAQRLHDAGLRKVGLLIVQSPRSGEGGFLTELRNALWGKGVDPDYVAGAIGGLAPSLGPPRDSALGKACEALASAAHSTLRRLGDRGWKYLRGLPAPRFAGPPNPRFAGRGDIGSYGDRLAAKGAE